MKIRKLNAATALGSLTASVALLGGMSGAYAQGAPGAGSFPGSFLVPGTQTSFKVGGYIKFDYTYDFSAQQGINGGAAPFGAPLDSGRDFAPEAGIFFANGVLFSGGSPHATFDIPAGTGHNIHGNSQMTASESRFNIETRTPTAYGELKTFIEGDFTNPNGLSNSSSLKVNSNSYGFRLRQAYGTLGPFLAGQTLSLFRDGAAEAETLDFGGAQATGVTRQPQVRYTFDFGNGLTLAVAAENPQAQVMDLNCTAKFARGSTVIAGTTFLLSSSQCGSQASRQTTFGQGQGDKIPDFTAALVYNAPWGHLNLHGVARDVYWHTGTDSSATESGASQSLFGWAIGFSGNWNVPIGKDSVAWEAAYGQGAGRYVNSDGPPTPDAFLLQDSDSLGSPGEGGRQLKRISTWLIAANYTHFWTDTLRSNVAGSYWHQDNSKATDSVQQASSSAVAARNNNYKSAWTAHANLIWSPVPQTNFGVEYSRMRATLENGRQGNENRLQLSAQFKF